MQILSDQSQVDISQNLDNYVEKQLNKIIIPFRYKQNYRQLDILEKNGLWESKDFSNHSLFQHVNNLIISNGKSSETIGKRLILNPKGRNYYELPNNTTSQFFLVSKEINLIFTIPMIELFLFETQIGFISFEINYFHSINIKNIVYGNYLLKRLSYKHETVYYIKNVNEQKEKIHFNLQDLVISLTATLEVGEFFENPYSKPTTSQIYSALVLKESFTKGENWKRELSDSLFLLRRGMKYSYKPSSKEIDLDDNPEIEHYFENSYWGLSLEGLANLVYLTDDSITNTFFTGTYWGNINNVYYYIYIVILHQRYALINLTNIASRISLNSYRSLNDYSSIPDLSEIYNLQEEIALFNFRSTFSHISNNNHISKLYEKLFTIYRIDFLLKDLNANIPSIALIISRKNEIKENIAKEKENKKRVEMDDIEKHFHITLLIFTLIFILFTTTSDIWNIFINWDRTTFPANKTLLWSMLSLICVIWLTIIVLGRSYLKLIKKRKLIKNQK